MSIMNSKERKARNRGRKQGYVKALEDMMDYIIVQRNVNSEFDFSYLLQHMAQTKGEIKLN